MAGLKRLTMLFLAELSLQRAASSKSGAAAEQQPVEGQAVPGHTASRVLARPLTRSPPRGGGVEFGLLLAGDGRGSAGGGWTHDSSLVSDASFSS